MQAVTFRAYGAPINVCRVEELPMPTAGPTDVILRVHAASLNAADWRMIKGRPFPARLVYGGPFRPRRIVPGSDICGEVIQVGANVHSVSIGDLVIGELALVGMGAFAEYVAAPASALIRAPYECLAETAASLPLAAVSALQGLRDHAKVRPGDHVLITGASGGVGSFALQIAKDLGATVTAVCRTEGVDAVRRLGVDDVIDRTKEDPYARRDAYDVVFDCAGYRPPTDCVPSMRAGGRYVFAGGSMANLAKAMAMQAIGRKPNGITIGNFLEKASTVDLAIVRDMAETGRIRPIIDSVITLAEVPTALDRLERGGVVGKVILRP